MSWELKKLDDLGTVSRGRSRHRPRDADHLYGGPYPFIQTGDVKHSELFINSYSQTYSEEGLAQSKLWPKGTLCITIAANIADTSILDIEACFPDSIIGFIADEQKANTLFVKYLFDAVLQRRYKKFSHGATQDNLSQTKLLSIDFPVPPIPIQNRIASILSTYDELIQNNKRRIELLEKSARLLYKEWFVQFRFPGFEHTKIVDGVPEGWEKKKINDLGEIVTGKTPSTKNDSYYGGSIPFIKTPDMHGNMVVTSTELSLTEAGANTQKNKYLPKHSILVSCIGSVGVVSLNDKIAHTNQQINAILPKNDAHRYWILFFAKELKPILEAIGGGATMNNVNKTKFSSIDCIVPPASLIEMFNDYAEKIVEQIEKLTLQNQSLSRARDLLLPKLMNGDIPV